MAVSLNYKLSQLASSYYISSSSSEATKIGGSLNNLRSNLKSHFNNDISTVVEFGSYKRDTILPRKFDESSDVDLMIVFNHASINVNPSTYRRYLHSFAAKYYPNSIIYKSTPTVVLELYHIKYDLVATHQADGWSGISTYIPKSETSWMETDPHGFNRSLSEKNKNNSYNIKPVIRLLKAWNAKVGYPIDSYELEKEIVSMSFFFNNTLEDYFFDIIDSLSSYRGTSTANSKVNALKENARRVKDALEADNLNSAWLWLGHILPL